MEFPPEPPRRFEAPATHPAARTPRARALRRWLDEQIEIIRTPVTIPDDALQLSIAQPSSQSRQQLFDLARASEERQLPYWADVWPSGLALASVALQRSADLAGRHVLEIGSGLGSTAAAVLSTGASLTAIDYSPLALGLCRYNAMLNVGTSPRAMAVNWRHPSRQTLYRLDATGPFPIILAADVLYESRDIEPLIGLIERLLAPDGELWISEPGRKVASRFLDTLALSGWRFTSHSVDYARPDGGSDRIHIHIVRRDPAEDVLRFGSIGGWRV